jgi:hypothetical protein
LVISQSRYYYAYSNCEGTGELSYGLVATVDGQRVHLSPTVHVRPNPPLGREPGRRARITFETDLYVIRWNEEQFIVTASQMPQFCLLVHTPNRSAMRHARFPRVGSTVGNSTFRESDFSGLPDVPAEFRHLLPAE